MDPYIEVSHRWTGFHNAFMVACAQQLNQRLPPNYIARIEERLQVLSEEEERELGVVPDSVVLDEPMETFLQVQRFPDERVICAVEMLSPSNKSGKGRSAYLAKRFEYRHQHVNLVEIDLLLGGQRVPLLAPLPTGHYFTLVTRAPTRHQCEVYAWSVRDLLATVPVPLDDQSGDVPLDLKGAFDAVWDGFRYEMVVRYNEPPPAQFSATDRAWVIDRAAAREKDE